MSKTVDRRDDYYSRAAKFIAADPLGFYTRAERGRRIQADFPWNRKERPPVVSENVIDLKSKKKARR